MSKQYSWFILTIKEDEFNPENGLPEGIDYMRGQKEQGEGGFVHWQIVAHYARKVRIGGAKKCFSNTAHLEPTRSSAAIDYVWKEETRIDGTQFELGKYPMSRKRKEDWDDIWKNAKKGKIEEIPPDIRIKHYNTLRKIQKDYMDKPDDLEDVCGIWYYGVPGAGKSHAARQEYPDHYLKPCNKWWDGYQDQDNVIIDDFDINHKVLGHYLKIWSDKYSYIAENKGSGIWIRPKKIVITSNYSIEDIFGEDKVLTEALKRRFQCKQFLFKYNK